MFVSFRYKACHEETDKVLLPISERMCHYQDQQEAVPVMPSSEMSLNWNEARV